MSAECRAQSAECGGVRSVREVNDTHVKTVRDGEQYAKTEWVQLTACRVQNVPALQRLSKLDKLVKFER